MEADLPSQYHAVSWSLTYTQSPFHGIRMDAKRKRARLRCRKPGRQSITIGVLTQKCVGIELTQAQLLDISRGLLFLHSLEIVHGDLKGVCLCFFSWHTSISSVLIISNFRIIFSLTDRVVHDLVTSGSPPSLVLTAWRLPCIGSEDHTNGWPPNSSISAQKKHPVSPPANQTFLLWEWSHLRCGTSVIGDHITILKPILTSPSDVYWTSAILGV